MAEHGLSSSGELTRNTWRFIIPVVLFLQLTIAVAGLSYAIRGPSLDSLWLCLLLGLVLAWLLAFLRQPVFESVILLITVGFFYVLLVPSGLGSMVAGIGQGGFHWILGYFPYYNGEKIGIFQLVGLLRNVSYSLFVLIHRSQVWIEAMGSGKPAFDPQAATLAWNGLVWIVAIWAGWIIETRQNALLAILPSVLLSLGTLSSGQHMYNGLYLMLGSTIILLAIVQHARRQQSWISGRIAFPAHKGRQIINFALLVTILIVILAAAVGSISAQRIHNWIDALRNPPVRQQNSLAQSLGILPEGTPVQDKFRSLRSPGLPREHLIGTGPELSSRIVMTVKVKNLAELSSGYQPLPMYWRGYTYDVYTGQGWTSSATVDYKIIANSKFHADRAQGHLVITEDFFPIESLGGTVFAAGDPVRINSDSEAAWRSSGDLFGVQTDNESAYEVISLVPISDDTTLRQSGENYPDWVRQRFLTLPTDMPERVKSLALRLTVSGLTPYDRAVAIEDYLRTYPYSLHVPIPPPQLDVTDYFLFDLKKGYCDYFSTSMVVLARLAGIPARLAIGYATGTYNLNSNRFSVSEADAHSWAELYFPGIGWIPFEATPSRPSLDRTSALPTEPTNSTGNQNGQLTRTEHKVKLVWFVVPAVVLCLIALLGFLWFILAGVKLFFLPDCVAVAEIYLQLKRMAIRLGTHIESGDTPNEFLAAFSLTLNRLTLQGLPVSIITRLTNDSQSVINGIIRNSYQASGYSCRQIVCEWFELRQKLWQVWVYYIFGRIGFSQHSQTGSING